MNQFILLFGLVFVLLTLGLTGLALTNKLRKNSPGCSGNHDCVMYKGEKVQCPSCELKEYQAQVAAEKANS